MHNFFSTESLQPPLTRFTESSGAFWNTVEKQGSLPDDLSQLLHLHGLSLDRLLFSLASLEHKPENRQLAEVRFHLSSLIGASRDQVSALAIQKTSDPHTDSHATIIQIGGTPSTPTPSAEAVPLPPQRLLAPLTSLQEASGELLLSVMTKDSTLIKKWLPNIVAEELERIKAFMKGLLPPHTGGRLSVREKNELKELRERQEAFVAEATTEMNQHPAVIDFFKMEALLDSEAPASRDATNLRLGMIAHSQLSALQRKLWADLSGLGPVVDRRSAPRT